MDFFDSRYGEPRQSERPAQAYVGDLLSLLSTKDSEMRGIVERFSSDLATLRRFYSVNGSSLQLARLGEFYRAYEQSLAALPYDELSIEGRVDWHLLTNKLRHLLASLERERQRNRELGDILPTIEDVAALQEDRRQFEPLDPIACAARLTAITRALQCSRQKNHLSKSLVFRATQRLEELKKVLADWHTFYNGYDIAFTWWCRVPYTSLVGEIDGLLHHWQSEVLGIKPGQEEPIVGDSVGLCGLMADLEHEMIPYTPDELIALAEEELAWCRCEWVKVAAELGLGDDWRAAVQRVMEGFVAPGEQPALVANQAYEAIAFLRQRDLLSIPPLAIDCWRMSMMGHEAQKTSPFFLGGELLQVSFPLDTMTHEEKMASLMANNRHLARATVHHELIPGHHLQMFMTERSNPYRRLFYTPFWIEGWALYWEFRLWDLDFPQSALDRGGMLFWRTHRAARIVFSLQFHLGRFTPEDCIDYLIEQVGHSRHTATGEVRRSFNGHYPPLYQLAYMVGAWQMQSLYREFVVDRGMAEKEFHDRVLQANTMPLAVLRSLLAKEDLPRHHLFHWRFATKGAG